MVKLKKLFSQVRRPSNRQRLPTAKNHSPALKSMCGALECHCKSLRNLLKPQFINFLICSYNIATGLYPFEGDNIYRLLENIGKGVWSVPVGLDPLLTDLLLNMLRFDALERYTIQKIRNHSWFISSPANTGDAVPVPPLKGDSLRSSTVLPYLESYHYDNRQNHNVFFTEHDLNGKATILKPSQCLKIYFFFKQPKNSRGHRRHPNKSTERIVLPITAPSPMSSRPS